MKKEEFVPLCPGKVKMYVCGPTVYNYFHVGNARPLITFDVLRRYFEYRGFEVTLAQNFTDVDDKIINRANELGVTSVEIAEKYIAEYYTDARGLGVRDATIYPKATENIAEIIAMISELVEKGMAYQRENDVYYRTASFSDYGKLSKQPIEELLAGARVDVTEDKENAIDFALWKGAKPAEPSWDSPWGKGRPGWHIECSAMARRFLGDTIDIHCGGQDLIFPHHENEIAQSEGATGKTFARYWLHNGFINIDSNKMSKSLGNFFTVREAAQAYGYENIRMFMLMSHYRSPLNYSGEILVQAKNALQRIKTARENLSFISQNGAIAEKMSGEEEEFAKTLPQYRVNFCEAMDDDLNTADAIAVIFEMVRGINAVVADPKASKMFANEAMKMLDELTGVLGLLYARHDGDKMTQEGESADSDIEALIAQRQAAREEKDWAKADEIRNKLSQMGIVLEDTPQGVKWRRA